MGRIASRRVVVMTEIMVVTVTMLIISLSVVVEADNTLHSSPQILSSLTSINQVLKIGDSFGRKILRKMKKIVGLGSSSRKVPSPPLHLKKKASSDIPSGKEKACAVAVTDGFYLVKGISNIVMKDYLVAEYKPINDPHHQMLGLFAIFDGHGSHEIAKYLQSHLFKNIFEQPYFFYRTENAIKGGYHSTDTQILQKEPQLGVGGSTAVTAIIIDCHKLVVANVGDSRAVISKNGVAKQLSVDHEPIKEREAIEKRGGFVSQIPGDVPRVDGQLTVSRAFGDKHFKRHINCKPDVVVEMIDYGTDFLVLASHGLWKVMSNQEAVDSITQIKDPNAAAWHLAQLALKRNSFDDISCIVVRFHFMNT